MFDSKQFLGELPAFISIVLEKITSFPGLKKCTTRLVDQLTGKCLYAYCSLYQKVVAYLREVFCIRLKRILARLLISGKGLFPQPYNYWGLVGFGFVGKFPSIIFYVQAVLIKLADFLVCYFES